MRFPIFLAALALLPQEDPGPRLRRLVEQLHSDRAEEREEASRDLYAAGEKAVPFLREAERSSDSEVRARARAVLDRLEQDRREREADARAARLPDSWPGGTYDVLVGGKRAVRWSFTNEKVKRGGRDLLLLKVRYVERDKADPDSGFSVDLITTDLDERLEEYLCEPGRRLAPVEVRSAFLAPDLKGTFAGGGRKVLLNGDVLEAPEGSLLGGRPTHVAALMPFEKGAELAFHRVHTPARRLEAARLRCEGMEEIEAGGKKLKAWRFDDLAPGIDGEGKPRFSTWIGEDRRLLRAREDYYELVLSGRP
jgi:hypothetical protein